MTDRDTFAAAALTGLLVHANDSIDEETLDTPSDIAYTAYQMADAMLRERDRTNHTPVTKPMPKEKRAEASDGKPVAWAVTMGDGSVYEAFAAHQHDEAAELAKRCLFGADGPLPLAPLYRRPQPTLTDAEREAVARLEDHCARTHCVDTARVLRGLLERLT